MMWEMEKTAAGNGRKNSNGIRAVGRIHGKIAGRLETTHQKLRRRTIRHKTMNIHIILIQETEHKIIHSNGVIYSRAALTGITAVNGTTILSGIIIPGVITPLKITITPRAIIILHGITILKRITTYRLHPRQINPMLKHKKKSH